MAKHGGRRAGSGRKTRAEKQRIEKKNRQAIEKRSAMWASFGVVKKSGASPNTMNASILNDMSNSRSDSTNSKAVTIGATTDITDEVIKVDSDEAQGKARQSAITLSSWLSSSDSRSHAQLITTIARRCPGFTEPYPHQTEAILKLVVSQQDTVAIFPTGMNHHNPIFVSQ